MPLFNGKTFIEESLKSVQQQTYTDWEFIIVNDYGSDDGCADIVQKYAKNDSRIRLIQTEKRLGLAASLNLGLDEAKGEYIARVDVDDPSEPERFEKQVDFMDTHPEICLCSVWQQSVTPDKSYAQKVVFKPDELAAAMLFGCEISHCGVMLRKKIFDQNKWRYNPNYLGEDFELWNRVIAEGGKVANIPEVLVSHRWGFENISIAKGERLREEVRELSARMIARFGIDVSQYDHYLFSGWRNKPIENIKQKRTLFLKQGYQLLSEIANKNCEMQLYEQAALKKVLLDRWNWIRESCQLSFKKFEMDSFTTTVQDTVVSVVLPTFNSFNDISRAIDSVLTQTFTQWELLVVNDFGSNDGTAEIVRMYGEYDARIRLIQAPQRLGLAESLNLGIRQANGIYIARLDADDTAYPKRFEKQVALLEARPEVGICGTWQRHYGLTGEWIHKATVDEEQLRTNLLFWCDLCHSTLMLRKETIIQNTLFYDSNYKAEDYELWTRAIQCTRIVNIPEILGDRKESKVNITCQKYDDICDESGKIAAKAIQEILKIEVKLDKVHLLDSWENKFNNSPNREQELKELKEILSEILKKNEEIKYFNQKALLKTISAKWHWAKDNADWMEETKTHTKINTSKKAFDNKNIRYLFYKYLRFRKNNPKVKTRIKKIFERFIIRPIKGGVRKILKKLLIWAINESKQFADKWAWNYYKRINADLESVKNETVELKKLLIPDLYLRNRVPYRQGEKVRVVFLYQVASFWPSWEKLYEKLVQDNRFDIKMLYLDETAIEKSQMITAGSFIKQLGIPYIRYEDFDLENYKPHILIMQTPYDDWHRKRCHHSDVYKSRGYRIVYIPYGIEITDTQNSHKDHFEQAVILNAWRIYTFSEKIVKDYRKYCVNGFNVRGLGIPRFDSLLAMDKFQLSPELLKRINGRKVVLWKVHFPKVVWEGGKRIFVTPDLNEYVQFSQAISQFPNMFFIFLPHPKFKDTTINEGIKMQVHNIFDNLKSTENVWIDDSDDYRISLANANYIIVDRSAVMVEAALTQVPILFMSNQNYSEAMTQAIEPLVSSYYHGTEVEDMINFLKMCQNGEDPNKEERILQIKECLPTCDGHCTDRIIADMISGLQDEIE